MEKPYKPKILLIDLENTPMLAYVWSMYEADVLKVKEHSYLLSIAYQWYPSNKIEVVSLRKLPNYTPGSKDDAPLCDVIYDLIKEADVLVAQNGDAFDIKVLNTRFLFHRKPVPPPKETVDTLKILRRKFKHPSNKLDEICRYHGIGRKLPHTGKDLWFGCMEGSEKDWRLMEMYNAHDVYLLRKLYDLIRPWSPPSQHPNLNNYSGLEACPVCQATSATEEGWRRKGTIEYQRLCCRNCGKWYRRKGERIAKSRVIPL